MPVSVLPVVGAVVDHHIYPNASDLQEMASTEADHADVVTAPSSSDVKTAEEDPVVAVTTSNDEGSAVVSDTKKDKKGSPERGSNSPVQSTSGYPQALPAHLTPQPQAYYYSQTQVTPEPPSPAGATGYDVGAFLQPAAYGSPFGGVHVHQYSTAAQQPPNSPSHTATGSLTGVPPASPLFPTLSGQPTHGLLDHHHMFDGSMQQHVPGSPGPHYLSPGLGSVPNEFSGWTDNRNHQQHSYPPGSPAQGMPVPYVPGMPPRTAQVRSYSFEETMLPPSIESQQDQNYSTYGSSPNSTGGHFQHQQAPQWGYPSPDMYGMTAVSPLQPRPTMNYPGMPGGGRVPGQPMPNYGGQFYPTASPGPPIQTTASNKGPDGANLFIFHIPNHFSNMDMYQLFSPFGTLLSVRIMVEKESGRSRGFGFVSYDSPDAAAIAIKELNGYTIGNKRLKVQHKQIRSSEQEHERPGGGYNPAGGQHGGGGGGDGNYGGRGYMPSSLPPSGPMAMSSGWYQSNAGNIETAASQDVVDEPEDGAGPSSFSSMDPLRQSLPEVDGTN